MPESCSFMIEDACNHLPHTDRTGQSQLVKTLLGSATDDTTTVKV